MFDLLEINTFGRMLMEPLALAALRSMVASVSATEQMAAPQRQPSGLKMIPAKGGKNIARVDLGGTLMKSVPWYIAGTSTVQAMLDIGMAANDPNVHGIMLAIDSPGGTVSGTAELGDAIKAATRQKPVYAWVDGMAASAAYWAASQTDMIYAGNRMSQIGSIGTYAAVYDYSKAAKASGIDTHLITTGPLKGMGTPGTEITAEHVAHMQERINEMQTHFDDAVRKGRGMNQSQLTAVRSGAVWPAAEAESKRLIDGIKSYEQTLAALAAAS
jgi:signal peptide peptidase SppA